MHEITASHDYYHSPEALWEILADFGNIERWWPENTGGIKINRVELEGEGIGLTRHIYNEGFEHAISERLDYLDPENHVYKLSMVGHIPVGITEYQATGTITETSEGCKLQYVSRFSTETGESEDATAFLKGAYELMFQGLAQALDREAA